MGKESLKIVVICTRITDSLFCVPKTNTTLQINFSPIKINVKTPIIAIVLSHRIWGDSRSRESEHEDRISKQPAIHLGTLENSLLALTLS